MTHDRFDMGYSIRINISKVLTLLGWGHKKEYDVYARENYDNIGRPLTPVAF